MKIDSMRISVQCLINPIMGGRDGSAELSELMSSRGWHFNRLLFAVSFALLNLTAEIPETRYITAANCVMPNDDEDVRHLCRQGVAMQLPLPGSADSLPKAFGGGGGLRVILRGRWRERENRRREMKTERNGESGYSPGSP